MWNLLKEWVTRFFERQPVNDKEPNVLPTSWVSPHYTRYVTEYLNESFPTRWLGRGVPIEMSQMSPYFTHLDYYSWGHMNTSVYETKVHPRATLRHVVFVVAEHIRNHPNKNAPALQSLLMCAKNCLSTGGLHLEKLLNNRYWILVQGCSKLTPKTTISNAKSVLHYCWIFMCNVKCLETQGQLWF
jgi:hypothetical protein